MLRKRRIMIALATSFAFLAIATSFLLSPLLRANRSCAVILRFRDHIRAADWSAAQAMILPGRDLVSYVDSDEPQPRLQIRDERVFYWGTDVTNRFEHVRPRFGKTLEYYLTDPRRHEQDKVVFALKSAEDYAILESEKIALMKIY